MCMDSVRSNPFHPRGGVGGTCVAGDLEQASREVLATVRNGYV